ncbi:hypothetical protein [Hymenobacter glacieicola]|uniref:Uncharacterized protein n=1 Tax=Hymenobacter glacieicola TaxID=1562124 RepID=A0ABQ1X7T5_9BACT|nr:hypothetical protein [Hymenobacter glacieicola]GGG60254.1 hypothetical protein GCM10011378_40280 [Hymenobacter glacieicola]
MAVRSPGSHLAVPAPGAARWLPGDLTAEINLARILEEQMTLDITGHYARPDVFSSPGPC